jgi:hypothetical protein
MYKTGKPDEVKSATDEVKSATAEVKSATAEVKLAAAEVKLAAAEAKLAAAEVKLAAAEIKLAAAEVKLADAEVKHEDAEVKHEDAEVKHAVVELVTTDGDAKHNNTSTPCLLNTINVETETTMYAEKQSHEDNKKIKNGACQQEQDANDLLCKEIKKNKETEEYTRKRQAEKVRQLEENIAKKDKKNAKYYAKICESPIEENKKTKEEKRKIIALRRSRRGRSEKYEADLSNEYEIEQKANGQTRRQRKAKFANAAKAAKAANAVNI